MECRDVQMMALTTGEDGLSAETVGHLENCPHCRDFSESHRRIMDARISCEPDIELDKKVRRAARRRLRALREARDLRPRGFVIVRRCLAAAAAVAVLIALGKYFTAILPEQPAGINAVEVASRASDQSGFVASGDFDLEEDLFSLEMALLESEIFSPPVSEKSALEEDSVRESEGRESLDDALMELELSLCFEHAGLGLDRS